MIARRKIIDFLRILMTVLSCIYKKRQSVSWLAKLWHFFLKKFELTPRPPTAWPKSYICRKVFVSQVKPTLSPEVNPKMVLSASFVCDRGWRHEVSSVRKSKSYASLQKSQADLHNLGTKSFPKANAAHVCPTANFLLLMRQFGFFTGNKSLWIF